MKTAVLLVFLCLSLSCSKKDKNDDAPASTIPSATVPGAIPSTTPPGGNPAPTVPTDPAVPSATSTPPWTLNAVNCGVWGLGYDAEAKDCVRIATKEACDALANGSKFVLRFGIGECHGPNLQNNEKNCSAKGRSYDAASESCKPITTQAECDKLANGSVFDLGYQECVGVRFLPSKETCAAYGTSFDAASRTCVTIRTEAECTALQSEAMFDIGYGRCLGRCDYRDSITDACFLSR
ncbi:MAG TPA: hypothetical protein VE954_25590 [Oligoflexus sp.]|uniref:hypothetical protein n=1 Tax=Oligoflexus sp. TaxID=1971216 RepID=UPI002D2A2234|nr:hypothetical protein [Oligoflexus sp.]HYX36495.1 hypothetical protein [Oligoflexus sp.]